MPWWCSTDLPEAEILTPQSPEGFMEPQLALRGPKLCTTGYQMMLSIYCWCETMLCQDHWHKMITVPQALGGNKHLIWGHIKWVLGIEPGSAIVDDPYPLYHCPGPRIKHLLVFGFCFFNNSTTVDGRTHVETGIGRKETEPTIIKIILLWL